MHRTPVARRLLPLILAAGFAVAAAAISRDAGKAELPQTISAHFGLCHEGGGTNCVVDGDTAWIAGQKFRITGIDAPETHEPKCPREGALGKAAAQRLQALLNSGTVTVSGGA
jgi:endonuclease YncB( thermonuclease family)